MFKSFLDFVTLIIVLRKFFSALILLYVYHRSVVVGASDVGVAIDPACSRAVSHWWQVAITFSWLLPRPQSASGWKLSDTAIDFYLDRVRPSAFRLCLTSFSVKAKLHYAISVADRSEAGRRLGRRPEGSWNLAYHALSSSLAAS